MGVLTRLVRIERGETRLALSLIAVMFLTSLGAGAGATAADALLFARFGVEGLPQLYLALGIVSFVVALIVSIVFGTVRRERAYPVTLLALAAGLLGLRAITTDPGDVGYPAMWLGANVVTMLQGIVGWGVASWLCDARQAKRLFPLANAAKIGGAILGAAAVVPLVALFRLEDLLVLWALTLVLTFVLVARLGRTAPAAPIERRTVSLSDELFAGFRVVAASPLLRWLAVSLVLFSVLFFSLALPFTRAARAAMPQEDDLASFLGLFNASTTAAAFLASLFVANRVYARFGVVNAILGFTLIYLGGFITLVLTDSFVAIAAARWLQLAWLAGIADAAYQALFNPVPQERRDQMRAFMEGVPGQAGIALAGLLLLLGDRALEPREVALAGVLVAAATTVVIWRTRGAYRDALVAALRAGRPEPFLGADDAYAALLHDAGAVRIVTDGLRSDDIATRRASVQILADLRANVASGAVRALADDAEPAVRLAALSIIARAGDDAAATALRQAAAASDAATRQAAVHAVATSSLADAAKLLETLGLDADGAVCRAALAELARYDAARALALALARLASQPDDALGALEAMPAARASAELAAFATAQRERAVRYASLVAAVPADGDVASLLRLTLERRRETAARWAVRGAAILSGRRAPAAMLDGLVSPDPRRRAESLEGLETYVRADLARPLLSIWEGERVPSPLDALRDDPDPWIRDCYAMLAIGGKDMTTLATIPLMERVLFLHRVPLFAALDPADLQQVARIATERAFADGEVIGRQGEMGDALHVVMSGAVRVEQDGRVVATRGAGEAVGEMSIVRASPRIANLVAAGDTKTLRIGRVEFESILRDRPETAIGVIRVLAERLTEATARG